MRNRTLLLLACYIGLSGGVSCTTRQSSSSSSQTASNQAQAAAAAEAKAQKEQDAANAKALKKAAADAKLKQEQDAKLAADAARAKKEQQAADAEALKKTQGSVAPTAPASVTATSGPVPAMNPNAPLTKEQKLDELNRRYKNDEITPLEYQTARAKIMAEP